jgi:hypothetical protein
MLLLSFPFLRRLFLCHPRHSLIQLLWVALKVFRIFGCLRGKTSRRGIFCIFAFALRVFCDSDNHLPNFVALVRNRVVYCSTVFSMEDEKFGNGGTDVTRYVLSPNTIKDKQMHSSAIGAGVETGSTVESDLNTNATLLLDLLGNRNNEDIKDIQERETFSNTEEGQDSRQRTTGASFIPDLKPTTQNAYGGGIYGTEEVPSPRRAARASNSQSADGPISQTPAHKDVKMHLSGDRGQDITGQSYIQ